MNTDDYKRRLQKKEQELSAGIQKAMASARGPIERPVGDGSDMSVDTEQKEFQLRDVAADSKVLAEVRDALRRIDNGTFGACVVDGKPIEVKRLEAIPWTPYCLKHQRELERPGSSRTATL
jgi:DnaK suppressor protein